MQIALSGNGWYPENVGGLEKYSYGLARALTSDGDSVDYFCTGTPSPWDSHSRTISIADPRHGTLRRLATMTQNYRNYYKGPYDVVDVHFAFYGLPLLPNVSKSTARVVHFQGPWALESRAEGASGLSCLAKAAIERFVYNRADRFVVLSEAFKTILHESYGISRNIIDVIPIGIDCDFFVPTPDREKVRASLGWRTEVPVIFTARRLVHRVGVAELIEATHILKKNGTRVSVKIAGKGPLTELLRASIAEKGLENEIQLLGFISDEDLVRAYQASDVTVLPTQSLEGFGTILSESLACGTPVIGTPVGGIVETLEAIDPSLIAASPSPESIATLIADFCSRRLNVPDTNACRMFGEQYAWPTISARNRQTYRMAMLTRATR